MRVLLLLWAFPLVFFWGWYGLSANDVNFGTAFLSRRTHDVVFTLYGNILGMPADQVPMALVKIFAFDSMIVFALAAFRWRKSWSRRRKYGRSQNIIRSMVIAQNQKMHLPRFQNYLLQLLILNKTVSLFIPHSRYSIKRAL